MAKNIMAEHVLTFRFVAEKDVSHQLLARAYNLIDAMQSVILQNGGVLSVQLDGQELHAVTSSWARDEE
jgi:hypothetical protein